MFKMCNPQKYPMIRNNIRPRNKPAIRSIPKSNTEIVWIVKDLSQHHSPPPAGSNGSITFPVTSPGRHILRIVAVNNKYDRDVVRRRVTLSEGPEECIVNLINDRVTYTENGVMVEFVGIGPLHGFLCRLDDGLRFPCN